MSSKHFTPIYANLADPAESSRNVQHPLAVDQPLQPRDGSSGSDEPSQRNLARCCICLEDNPTEEGLACPNGHFICDESLGNYFESRANIENIKTHRLNLPCPIPNCDAPSFAPLRVIHAHLPPAAVSHILENLDSVLEVFTERMQQQILVDDVRQVPQPRDQDDIERRRLHVVDNILTLKLPCCNMAFIDFSGCCALYCPNCPPLHNAFCAICLASCGADAHEHVRVEHGDVFISEEQWKAHHNRRRQVQLLEYFRGPGANCNRVALLDALRGDLAALGMNVEEIRDLLPEAFAQRPGSTRRWIVIGVVLFLVTIALSTALGIVISRRGGDRSVNSSVSNTMAATTSTHTAITATTSLSMKPSPTSFGPLKSDTFMELPSPIPQPTLSFRFRGPEQVIGEPDTFMYDDKPTAWSPETKNSSCEWLLLDYEVPVRPMRVDIYETQNPGAVVGIWVFPPGLNASVFNGAKLFWSGPPQTNLTPTFRVFHCITNNRIIMLDAQFVISRILIVVDNSVPGWNEIDAVGLVDQNVWVQWAKGAAASSSFAKGNYFAITSPAPSPASDANSIPWWQIISIVLGVLCFCGCCCNLFIKCK
ncbi:hypothetical protein BC938DRAFT_481989 [Jimgerdemannia flammicorona]|uniref:Uncharacterized protein n=1 Tax=Jimgerdemannia flammicorona TaxID=994334 RepID=A0A433QEW8_9FUNG|nr:hypothetical protein BC938DRAFT_481989 [Jimgerdemannia flammicorona]